MTSIEFTLRLLAALLAGLVIGFERQWHHKSAGLRTNTLVSVGAAIFVLLSINVTENGTGDVTRIIGQVVTGIGFLCAGIIFKEGINVHRLTTAVTVWCCSAVGCSAANSGGDTVVNTSQPCLYWHTKNCNIHFLVFCTNPLANNGSGFYNKA